MRTIPFNKPYIVGTESSYISQAMDGSHLSGDGPFTKKASLWLESNLDAPRALITHSCTSALEMAAILCDVQQGDEVIMPSYTFVSTANAFVLRGATPIFVDIREDTFNIDETLIRLAITSRTKAIVVVHYAGVACDMDAIMAIAKEHNLWVIEDAAQAIMSKFRGRPLGSIGHLGCLSFHETKNIHSGEGGALLINDEKLIERAEIIREKGTNRTQFFRGQVDKYTWQDIGSSYLPSELTAAFLYAQLENAEEIIGMRKLVWSRYFDFFSNTHSPGYERTSTSLENNGHMYQILMKTPQDRSDLIEHLRSWGINAVSHYVPLHSSPYGKRVGKAVTPMKNTDVISQTLLRLPIYPDLIEDQDIILASLLDFKKQSDPS